MPREVIADLAAGGRARPRRQPGRPLLRLRHRRHRAGRRRGRLADLDVGSERGPVRLLPVSRSSRRLPAPGWRSCSACRPGSASALVTGCQMAHVTALAAARHGVLSPASAGTSGSAASSARRRSGSWRAPSATSPSTARCGSWVRDRLHDGDRRRRAGPDVPGALRDALAAGDGTGDRLRPGRRRQHRRLRPPGRDRRHRRRRGRVAAHRRRLRPVGRRQPGPPPPRRRSRACRLLGVDAHKWLNVPYDYGIAFCAHPEAQRAAMGARAGIWSRVIRAARGRAGLDPRVLATGPGLAVYAALRSLGRSAWRTWWSAPAHTPGLRRAWPAPGCRGPERGRAQPGSRCASSSEDGNHDAHTDAVIAAVQSDGTCWLSGTTWQGMRAMRISVSSQATTTDDVDRSSRGDPRAPQRGL